jgi:hypothetical protein
VRRFDVSLYDEDEEVGAVVAITPVGDDELAEQARDILVEEFDGQSRTFDLEDEDDA